MQLGLVGLGRMGANIARRAMRAGHECLVYDVSGDAVAAMSREGAKGMASLDALAAALAPPRPVWMMVPTSRVEDLVTTLAPRLADGDILIDGGNSDYRDDIKRAAALGRRGIRYLDVGTSGGVWGLERGYCLMIGGDVDAVRRLDPIFRALAPGIDAASPAATDRARSTAAAGYVHCGASGAGHFVKMVHNGIEYGLMAAYAEGFNLLRHANAGAQARPADAETAPLADPENYRYDIYLASVAEVWRHGSVIASWLLDLVADALGKDAALSAFGGAVADSGEGRWTVKAAIDVSVPAPVLSAALFARFASRGEDAFADRLLSAMRHEFGGHPSVARGKS
ncbi:MAG: phosphogluconate dehydrogenase (NAD(+)-dependent, decarboxylating) [Casimicrobiaceae bacterium]